MDANGVPFPGRQWALRPLAMLAVTVLLLLTVALLAWQTYRALERALVSATTESIAHVGHSLQHNARLILLPARDKLHFLAYGPLTTETTLSGRLQVLPLIREMLALDRTLDALYAGYPNGDFVLFRPLHTDELRREVEAPDEAVLLVQSIVQRAGGEALGEYRFFDDSGEAVAERVMPDYRFDARTRVWYRLAREHRTAVITNPYAFFTTHDTGVTMARHAGNGIVLGLDATLDTLAQALGGMRMTASTEVALIADDGRVLAYTDPWRMLIPGQDSSYQLATVAQLGVEALQSAYAAGTPSGKTQTEDGRVWFTSALRLDVSDDIRSLLLVAIPEDEVLASAWATLTMLLVSGSAILLLALVLVFYATGAFARPLRHLADETRRLMAFDFAPRRLPRSYIREVDALSRSVGGMKETIAGFMRTSETLGAERDLERLMEGVLSALMTSAHCSGGAVYLPGEEGGPAAGQGGPGRREGPGDLQRCLSLGVGAARADARYPRHFAHGGAAKGATAVHPVPRAAATRATCRGEVDGQMLIATPLLSRDGALIGVLAMQTRSDGAPAEALSGFVEAIAGSMAVAIEARQLIAGQKKLLDGFIKIIADAIDAKSPYTGGHCGRVPAVAKLLAEALHATDEGPLRDFRLDDEDRETLHFAAWLHDCGKVTTPEYVVDKATKLEAVYNRIHEIRLRFELLKRDAEIAALQACLAGEDGETARARTAALQATLDDEFAFVAHCNIGSESLDDDSVARLKTIGERRWMRTLDDRLGLSRAELAQFGNVPAPRLPVAERLLADKAEHLVPRPPDERFTRDNPWGFAMQPPQFKRNGGELYNLGIRRGTLTAEERFIINDHIVQTIVMLEGLPFPRHLTRVPEIAGGHHERIDGRGYPRGLTGGEMSVLSRLMAIADVFEALTASDRPYKPAYTLSQAIGIMRGMVEDGHLDPDIFEVFLRSGVPLRYAEQFMEQAQIDVL